MSVKDQATPAPQQSWSETTLSNREIEDQLIRARVKMLLDQPFFGNLATRLQFIDATKWCPTAATDGRNFYFNRDFVAALSPEEKVFLLGHEVMHCVYDHMDPVRRNNRDPQLWNIAADFVINHDLVEASVGKKIELVQICYDRQYAGMTTEEIYDKLFEEAEKAGRVKYYTLDQHMEDQGNDGEGEGQESDKPGTGNNDGTDGPIRYSEAEKEQIKGEVQSAVLNSAKAAGAGNLPGGAKRIIDKLLNPQLDWRELLAMQIQSLIKSDYSWMRPSRKGLSADMYLPGMDYDETIDLAIAIDTSGSIGEDMLLDFISEVHGIMSQYTDFTIHLWCFDTSVHNYQKFTADTAGDLLKYALAGFGGTDFVVNYDFMKDQNIQPKKFVMFTDGYPWDSWGDEHYTDTLFIVHGGNSDNYPKSPWGLTVPYKRKGH
jgi:predicted metal-dependent peptidase